MSDKTGPSEQDVQQLLTAAQRRGIVSSSRMRGQVVTIVFEGLALHFDLKHAHAFLSRVMPQEQAPQVD